jgi:hypothetical protein
LHYLAKVKAEGLGSFFKWSGYLVLLAAVCLLAALTFKGARKVMHRKHRANMECSEMHQGMKMKRSKTMSADCSGMSCGHGTEMGMKARSGMSKMDCGSGDSGCCCCCGEMGMMEKGHMRSGCEHMESKSTTDTIDGKVIKKKIEILKK